MSIKSKLIKKLPQMANYKNQKYRKEKKSRNGSKKEAGG